MDYFKSYDDLDPISIESHAKKLIGHTFEEVLAWNRPGRTMLTSESTKNRSTHVVADKGTGRLRLLTEIEAERLQGCDDDWTKTCLVDGEEVDMPKRMRYFCMGNALVVPMITRMGEILDTIIDSEMEA